MITEYPVLPSSSIWAFLAKTTTTMTCLFWFLSNWKYNHIASYTNAVPAQVGSMYLFRWSSNQYLNFEHCFLFKNLEILHTASHKHQRSFMSSIGLKRHNTRLDNGHVTCWRCRDFDIESVEQQQYASKRTLFRFLSVLLHSWNVTCMSI